MMEFNIGDRVRSLTFGEEGVIEDKMFSKKMGVWLYTIQFDGSRFPFAKAFRAEDLEFESDPTEYRWELFVADRSLVTAVMYETVNGEEREVARNHGHIIHEGVIGIAQAASYAMKKIYIGMNDGQYIGTEEN